MPSEFVAIHSSVVSYTSPARGWIGLAQCGQLWDTGEDGVFTSCPTEFAAKETRRNKNSAETVPCCLGTEVLTLRKAGQRPPPSLS